MKTIYFYGIDNNKGGMENYALNLIRSIKKETNEYNFHIISEYTDFAYKDVFVNELNCSFSIVPSKKKHRIKYIKVLNDIFSKMNENDLAQINVMSYRNFMLFHSLKKNKTNCVIVGHATNTDNKLNMFVHKIFRHHYRKIGTKVGNNNYVINYLFGKKCKEYKIIELGIDKTKFSFNEEYRKVLRQKLGVSELDVVIGQIGRISKTKNYIFSAQIMNELKNKNFKLFIFGKGNSKKLNNYIKKNNLNNIYFMGETDEINKVYSALDIFIFPSLFESAGFALYEALANGCPSIVSPNVPLEGIENPDLSALPLSKEKWVEKIIQLANKKRNEKESVIPTLDKQIEKYLKLYEELTK